MEHSRTLYNAFTYRSLVNYDEIPEVPRKSMKWMGKYIDRCVASGEDIDQVVDVDTGDTALHRATQESRISVITILLNKGANPNQPNKLGKTAKQLAEGDSRLKKLFTSVHKIEAEVNSHLKLLSLFNSLTLKRNQEARSTINQENFFTAIVNNKQDVVKEMIERGGVSVLSFRDANHATATHIAALHGNIELIECLIKKGFSLDVGDKDGWTPLFYAVTEDDKNYKCVEYLLKQEEVDRLHCDVNKRTALHVAATIGAIEIVKILVCGLQRKRFSKSVHMEDKAGKKPIDLARKFDRRAVVSYLQTFSQNR